MAEVQDILRLYGDSYRRVYRKNITPVQYKAMRHIEICRTAALGGHVDVCDRCGEQRISYNSCRNRHCPKCQYLKKEKWLEDRMADLLPINYFHVVFTIPDILNSICLNNQWGVYDILFQSVSETLKKLSRDKKYLNARTGYISVLHTWGQNLMYHPHIHCIVTGGGLSNDMKKWKHSRSNFLFPVKVMAALFRGKLLAYLTKEFNRGKIKRYSKNDFTTLVNEAYKKEWVVYSKPPFKNPETVLKYLANYTHRIAISNNRIIKIEKGKVYFRWRDYADSHKQKVMALNACEFIRRFLLHVLPVKFVKIRHYGLFGNRNRKKILQHCRSVLKVSVETHQKNVKTWQQTLLELTGIDLFCCPYCNKGRMVYMQELSPVRCHSP
jgi:hypothetical protein